VTLFGTRAGPISVSSRLFVRGASGYQLGVERSGVGRGARALHAAPTAR